MAKKVVIEVEDYNKLVSYITSQPVPFVLAAQAAEVDTILRRSILMDIEITEPTSPVE
jgi:uncharacterized iron-regulated protein